MNISLYLIILLEGYITISLEILTIRQLMPIVGNSVTVTSLIIGVFLLFLAYGYRKGGTYKNNFTYVLQKNFILAALGFGIGLSYFFVEFFFDSIRKYFPHTTLLPLTIYLFLIIAPIVYILGQTVPITLNLWKKEQSLAATGGQILHLSTIGSFFGATLTALLLLNYLGVAWTIFIDFMVLVLLSLILMNIKTQKILLACISILGVMVYCLNINNEKSFFVATNNYANYHVGEGLSAKQVPEKYLQINDSNSSMINQQGQSYPYIETIKKILFQDLHLRNKAILVLGAGGFTLSAQDTRNNHFTYVDIDKQIYAIARDHFIAPINGDFIADDARHYLTMVNKPYDVIVSDVYSNRHNIPAHLVTQEYFASVKNALLADGIAIFNILGVPGLDDAYSKHMDTTIRSVFSNCMVIPTVYTLRNDSNLIYVCKKSTRELDKAMYTDDLNHATMEHGIDHAT